MEIPADIKNDSVAKAIERNRAELARLEKEQETQAAMGGEDVETIPVIEGFVESVSISATINLGNYSNTKLEVSASSGEYARKVFREEIGPTIEMVQGIIKQVSANDEKGVHRSR